MKLDNRLWVGISVLVSMAILAGGWFIGIDPQLQLQKTTNEQRETVEARNTVARADIARLKAASENLPALETQLAGLQAAVPPGINGSDFIASLDKMAVASGATLTSFTLADPIAYEPAAPPAAQTADAAEATDEADGDSDAEGTPSAPAGPNASEIAPTPATDGAINADNFVIVPISLTVEGTNDNVLDFLGQLQDADRLVLVTGLQKARDNDGVYSLNISGGMFVLRNAQAEADALASSIEAFQEQLKG